MYKDLIKRLRTECTLPYASLQLMREAADAIEELDAKYNKALQDLVKLAKNSPKVGKHGRLIDADAFIAEQQHLYCENCAKRKGMKNGKMKFVYDIGDAPCRACEIMDVLDSLEDAPTVITVIPAEEGE